MSENICAHPKCERERFEDQTKCIFHCEKNDWFEIANAGQWNEKRDWSKNQDKIDLFWTAFINEWNEEKYDYSHFVFPQFEENIFKKLYQDYLDLPNEIKSADDKISIFEHAKFLDKADFKGITFTREADFSNAIFTHEADFSNATFTHEAHFSNANFMQRVAFFIATFTQTANFSNTTFTQGAAFSHTTFTREADFSNATFTQTANFSNATFTQTANFSNTTFTERADFSVSTPVEAARDAGKIIPAFEEEVTFTDASFGACTTFQNREFKAETGFANAKFDQAPNMHGAKLYFNTNFTGITCGTENPDSSYSYYRLLKEIMEEDGRGDRRAASVFYAAEQHCLLKTGDLGEVETVISWFYKSASYYGSSISRPLGLLLGFQTVFPLLFFSFKPPSLSAPTLSFSVFLVYPAIFATANLVAFAIYQFRSKRSVVSDILDFVAAPLAIALVFITAFSAEGLNQEGYWKNWVMLLTNLFRPFYGWNNPPNPLRFYLFGLLHLTLMYSAFALLLFAIRRRFKME